MLGIIADVMEAVWNFIPADVWLWVIVIVWVILFIARLKPMLWLGFFVSCFGFYFALRIGEAIANLFLPMWLELLVELTVIGVAVYTVWKSRHR